MESKTDDSVVIQECWKMMLEVPQKMQKLNINTSPQETDSGKQKGDVVEVLMVLKEDLERVSYSDHAKSKKETTIEISSISSVLSGTDKLPDNLPEEQKTWCFSLTTQEERLVFMAPSEAVAKDWVLGLQRLVANQKSWYLRKEREREWFREVFQKFSSSADHHLKFSDVFQKVLNPRQMITEEFYTQKMKEFLKKKKLKYKPHGFFSTREQFEEFYRYIFEREDVIHLFRRTAADGVFVTPSDLKHFLTKEQREEDVTLERCEQIIRTFEITETGKQKLEMQVLGFTRFLLSRDGDLFRKRHDEIYQDMTRPLPHYYIASSHNTYLCGRQLSGESSAQAYKNVIERGCRCVELDCWDGDDGEPIVYHGYTLTSKVLFKDIVKAIDESAFTTSPYPLIMSLENHCSTEVQRKLAKHLEEILGEKLYKIPVDLSLKTFPSPEFFKYKILVRGKVDNIEEDDKEESSLEKQEMADTIVVNVEDGAKMKEKENFNPSIKVTTSPGNDVPPQTSVASTSAPLALVPSPQASPSTRRRRSIASKAKKKVAKELADLINYISNSKFLSHEDCAINGKFYQSSSFVEKDMEDHVQNSAEAFIGYNMRQISRIYPGGLRIDSSNYDPIKPWNVGSQIVALNHQTNDEAMNLYYGKFRQNGRAGYVLKPAFLRDPSFKFNPLKARPSKHSKTLKLTVLSGQQLPVQEDTWSLTKDEPDPYVRIQVRGVPADETAFTTSVKIDNSFNPVWNERFEMKVLVPELAMVRFGVWDSDIGRDDFIGQATLPFESMQQGYRHVPLVDMDNQPIPCASIFVHVVLEDLIVAA